MKQNTYFLCAWMMYWVLLWHPVWGQDADEWIWLRDESRAEARQQDDLAPVLAHLSEALGIRFVPVVATECMRPGFRWEQYAGVVTTHTALESLTGECQAALERYMAGHSGQSGGSCLVIGGASSVRGGSPASWLDQVIAAEVAASHQPALAVMSYPAQPVLVTRELPHPTPGAGVTGGRVAAMPLIHSTDEAHVPLLEQQLTEVFFWLSGWGPPPATAVYITRLQAQDAQEQVWLTWELAGTTATPTTFALEFSADGISWEVAERWVAPPAPSPLSYSYADHLTAGMRRFYRLSIQQAGTPVFSDVLMVIRPLPEPTVSLYPNPVQTTLDISVACAGQRPVVTLENRAGQLVSRILSSDPAVVRHTLDMTAMPAGMYLLRVEIGDTPYIYPVIKQ